jgi:acetolactate decarboxylase
MLIKNLWNSNAFGSVLSGKRIYMRTLIAIAISIGILLYSSTMNAQTDYSITVAGSLKSIMQEGDLTAKIDLDTIEFDSSSYGLGVSANLRGEIMIIAGHAYHSYLKDNQIVTREFPRPPAAMFVMSNAGFNTKATLPPFKTLGMLENWMESTGTALTARGTFAFLFKTNNATINYHIIDWHDHVEHTPSNHKQFAKNGTFVNEDVVILGFFSEKHHGIFIPHTSNIHLHVYSPSKRIVGHVDAIELFENVTILLP